MVNAEFCVHIIGKTYTSRKGLSFPGVLFILSSSSLASCWVRRASNCNASVGFIKEQGGGTFTSPQTSTCTLGREGDGCQRGNFLCIMLRVGSYTDHAFQALWLLAVGKQVAGEILGFFSSSGGFLVIYSD